MITLNKINFVLPTSALKDIGKSTYLPFVTNCSCITKPVCRQVIHCLLDEAKNQIYNVSNFRRFFVAPKQWKSSGVFIFLTCSYGKSYVGQCMKTFCFRFYTKMCLIILTKMSDTIHYGQLCFLQMVKKNTRWVATCEQD